MTQTPTNTLLCLLYGLENKFNNGNFAKATVSALYLILIEHAYLITKTNTQYIDISNFNNNLCYWAYIFFNK